MQNQNDVWPPFVVRVTVSECECKYFQTEREALALSWTCKRYHAFMYIYEIKFDLVTNHKQVVIYEPVPIPVSALISG